MNFHWDLASDVFSLAGALIGWCIVLSLALRRYTRELEKPAIWRLAMVLLIGLFSFTLPVQVFQLPLKLAILPLGVWIVFLATRKPSWMKYRYFAWLSFWSNYIFAVLGLIAGLIHGTVYPQEKPATYITGVEGVAVAAIHPTAVDGAMLNVKALAAEVHRLNSAPITGLEWHQETRFQDSPLYEEERFPYMLLGTKARWGSGIKAVIYVESDGRGLLITTADKGYYYRSDVPLLDRGDGHAQ